MRTKAFFVHERSNLALDGSALAGFLEIDETTVASSEPFDASVETSRNERTSEPEFLTYGGPCMIAVIVDLGV